MHTFFADLSLSKKLSEPEIRHFKVLRISESEVFRCVNGAGSIWSCQMDHKGNIEILSFESVLDSRKNLSIALPAIDSARLDFAVEKLSELGVKEMVLFNSERSQVSLYQIQRRLEHLKKISISAIKQSKQAYLPKLTLLSFESLLSSNFCGRLFCGSFGQPILDLKIDNSESAVIAIGPEGGFSQAELELFKSKGWIELWLGATTLRTETASIVASSLFLNLH